MFIRTRNRLLAIALLSIACAAHGDSSVGASAHGIGIGIDKGSAAPVEQATPSRSCLNHCDAADSKCSTAVRRARQECSKKAANSGRDPFTMRNDYTYFCGYFGNQGRCGADTYSQGCKSRYARTYGLCVDRMQDNIASARYDCYTSERDAQNFCRTELRDCRAACDQK